MDIDLDYRKRGTECLIELMEPSGPMMSSGPRP
jgi:hypothetical protein